MRNKKIMKNLFLGVKYSVGTTLYETGVAFEKVNRYCERGGVPTPLSIPGNKTISQPGVEG